VAVAVGFSRSEKKAAAARENLKAARCAQSLYRTVRTFHRIRMEAGLK
jgi:hypothetical protein